MYWLASRIIDRTMDCTRVRFTKFVEKLDTDQYVTMTIFQLEKEFGDGPDAQAFIDQLIKGAQPISSVADPHMLVVGPCMPIPSNAISLGQKPTPHPQAPGVAKARMVKVLKCVIDERRRGTRAESSVGVKGEVNDQAHKKVVAEKLAPALNDLEGMELFDAETGRIKFPKPEKPAKILTAEEKLAADFKKLTNKSYSQHASPQDISQNDLAQASSKVRWLREEDSGVLAGPWLCQAQQRAGIWAMSDSILGF